MKDEYYEPEVVVRDNFIVTIRRPILTPEERAKRMKAIHDAAARLILPTERSKKSTEN